MAVKKNDISFSLPFPWFGMNHIWNRQWDQFDWDEKAKRWAVGKELKDRISKARAIQLNINRFSLNVFDLVRTKHGNHCRAGFSYPYTYEADGTQYCVEIEPLQKIATLIRYCSSNRISSLPVLMSGGDPGISRFDPHLLAPSGLDHFMQGYWGRCAALVHALAEELLTSEKGDAKAYESIISYEIENEFNHGIHHPLWDDFGRFRNIGIRLLAGGGRAVRDAEQTALRRHRKKLKPRPILYNWDFDYPLFLRGELDILSGRRRTKQVTEFMIEDIERLMEAGAPVDIIGLDVYPDPGSRGPFGGGRGYSNISLDDVVSIVEELCSSFNKRKVVIAETGLSEYNALHIPDRRAQQDFYLKSMEMFHELYLSNQRPGRRNFLGIIYYEWKDPGYTHWGLFQEWTFWRKEKNFGIFDSAGDPKQVYEHLRDRFGQSRYRGATSKGDQVNE